MQFPNIASKLKSATTNINIASASTPSNGQVLTATSPTTATWKTPTWAWWWASFDWVRWQVINIAWEIVPWKIAELTAFSSWTFAEIQISTLTRTTWTTTVTVKKNNTTVGSATITSATTVTNWRYFWTSTDLADSFVANDVITIEVSDNWSPVWTNLVCNLK